jgi:hypothetical protein
MVSLTDYSSTADTITREYHKDNNMALYLAGEHGLQQSMTSDSWDTTSSSDSSTEISTQDEKSWCISAR